MKTDLRREAETLDTELMEAMKTDLRREAETLETELHERALDFTKAAPTQPQTQPNTPEQDDRQPNVRNPCHRTNQVSSERRQRI
jgi:hypothetical protein